MHFINKFFKEISRYNNIFFISMVLVLLFGLSFLLIDGNADKLASARDFISLLEAKTFDLRQVAIAKKRQVSDDIVIIGVDNVSQEHMIDNFGSWPMPRSVYADFLNYIQIHDPAVVGVDVLFVNSWKNDQNSDVLLANTFRKYDNVFAAIYFDDYDFADREPSILPSYLASSVEAASKNFKPYTYPNTRNVFPELIYNNSNFGHMNLERSKDGVIRTLPLFVKYPKYEKTDTFPAQYKIKDYNYYANFGLKLLVKYLEEKNGSKIDKFVVDKQNNLFLGSVKVPMRPSAEAILNWYGGGLKESYKTFNYVSFKDIYNDIQAVKNNKKPRLDSNLFKDKMVIMGFTADSLSDIKTVPNYKLFPGVGIYATFINNVLDGIVIKKASLFTNALITLFLVVLVAFVVLKVKPPILSSLTIGLITLIYIWLSFFVMEHFNLWIYLVVPIISIIFTVTFVYFCMYVFKAKDYEYAYELATVDSLTGLYNHRFFKEQLEIHIETAKRYSQEFSIILIDVDNFKKFNDEYGHQAGDMVLRQVAVLLKNSVRRPDIVCRYGGEEIVIILPNTNNSNAYILAEKLRKLVENRVVELKYGIKTNVTISLGVATCPGDAESVEELIEVADKLMYQAKSKGRNRVGKKRK